MPCGGTCEEKPRSGPPESNLRPGPEQPAEQYVTRETGFFQAPPRSGAFQGARNSFGVSLGGLTIPEMRLALPTLELPSLSRSRQNARMLVDSAVAPWVSTGSETVRLGPTGSRTAVAGEPEVGENRNRDLQSRGAPNADCEDVKRQYEAKVRELQRKIDDCEQLRRCIEDCLKSNSQTSATPGRRQGEQLLGEVSPNSGLRPLPSVAPPAGQMPKGTRDVEPRTLQPATFKAFAQTAVAPAQGHVLLGTQEFQRLPAIPENEAKHSGLSRVNYDAPVRHSELARRLPAEHLPEVP